MRGLVWHVQGMPLRILVVDDKPDFVDWMMHGLRANGIECLAAFTGMEALDAARLVKPDAVMLDSLLPDLDGFTVCEMLRRHPATVGMPVLMLTCLGGSSNATDLPLGQVNSQGLSF